MVKKSANDGSRYFTPNEAENYLKNDEPFAALPQSQVIINSNKTDLVDDLYGCTCDRNLTKCSDDPYCRIQSTFKKI